MNRYEVRGLVIDKELVREIARRLAVGGTAATRLRAELAQTVAPDPTPRGGVLDLLRRSPLVGAELRVKREVEFKMEPRHARQSAGGAPSPFAK